MVFERTLYFSLVWAGGVNLSEVSYISVTVPDPFISIWNSLGSFSRKLP